MKDLDIRHFKLTNGENIVGLIAVRNDDNYIIERPVAVTQNLAGSYSFTPWFPFSEAKTFKVNKVHILQHVPLAEAVKHDYIQFALQLTTNSVDAPAPKSDHDIFKEYEQQIWDQLESDETTEESTDDDITIH
tara:strand:+ start:9 stop:407 length:399 start_codon:yes stop_codon:yes gene_type:complete